MSTVNCWWIIRCKICILDFFVCLLKQYVLWLRNNFLCIYFMMFRIRTINRLIVMFSGHGGMKQEATSRMIFTFCGTIHTKERRLYFSKKIKRVPQSFTFMNTGSPLLPLPPQKGHFFFHPFIAFWSNLCTYHHLHVSLLFAPFHRVGEYLLLHWWSRVCFLKEPLCFVIVLY